MIVDRFFRLNEAQKALLQCWWSKLQPFFFHALFESGVGYSVGTVLTLAARWSMASGWVSIQNVAHTVAQSTSRVDGGKRSLWIYLLIPALILSVRLMSVTVRAARSWIFGVTSGSWFWGLLVGAIAVSLPPRNALLQCGASLLVLGGVLVLGVFF